MIPYILCRETLDPKLKALNAEPSTSECEAKLNIASEKYHTMNERLSARLRTADKHKDTLFNEQVGFA